MQETISNFVGGGVLGRTVRALNAVSFPGETVVALGGVVERKAE
jgi:hypothetical protein